MAASSLSSAAPRRLRAATASPTCGIAAYGWPANIADDDLLERMLALNFAREPAGAVPAGVLAGSGAGDDDEEMGGA